MACHGMALHSHRPPTGEWRELSDWPPPMVPPETPQPMVLVVDLEDTLVKSTWDRRYGWRHAKRPGVDRFLEQMSKSYEIVIFTSNMFGIADPVVSNLDTKGYVLHRLFRDACWYKDGVYVKNSVGTGLGC